MSAALISLMKDDYTWIRGVRDALLAGDLVDPPDWVRNRARRLFDSARSSQRASSLMARIRAALVFDSRRKRLAPAGVRATAVVDGSWQLLYRGGDIDIDLMVRPSKDGRTLNVRGQALPIGGGFVGAGMVEAMPTDGPRRLHGATAASARSALEPSGEFALSNLARGRYDVLLHLGAREIELSDLEL